MDIKVTVNQENGLVAVFEEEVQVGKLDFIVVEDVMSIVHTRTFPGNEGKGIAGALVQAATDYAVEHDLTIKPVCSYAYAWYMRHPQYNDRVIETDPESVSCSIHS